MKAQIIVPLLALMFTTASFGDTIANWTFEASQPVTAGGFAPEIGAGSALGHHAGGAAVYSSPVGNGSAHSFSSNVWAVNDYYQFQVSSLGYQNIGLSFDQTGSNTGPRDFKVAYSTDGSSFSNFSNYSVLENGGPNPNWSSATPHAEFHLSFDLSSLTALNNQSSIYLRLLDTSTTSTGGGTVGTAGSDRVDNVIITGSPTLAAAPAPTAFLGGTALFSLLALWRRRQAMV